MGYRSFSLRSLIVALACIALVGTVQAQDPGDLQSPDDFLGYELGTQFTMHHQALDYVEHVAEHSPNVEIEQYGTTHQGRPLMLAYVSAPDNMDRLDTIRENNLRHAGLRDGDPEGDSKAIVWLSYSIHGDESVGTEAALPTLYDLANPDDNRTQAWLDDTVVIIDPLLNPDGRERYVQWFTQTVGDTENVRPEAREHDQPWPGGRSNHYYFDLNRDWAWGTQKETQHRIEQYNRWLPHVHVDFHEMGVDSPYYFAPGAEPFHTAISDWQREFQQTIGENNARYFDERDRLYFTREVFDLFYPSYGDTWPLFSGAIGMTYEQGGSGRAGLGIITEEGDTLTLADRIEGHYISGLSTVEATAEHHERVIEEFRQYHERAQNDPPGDYASYLIKQDDDGSRLSTLAEQFEQHDIEFGFAEDEQSVSGHRYATRSTESATIEEGDMIVDLHQPKGHLAHVLLEPEPTLVDSLTYDITAWALPYAYGLDAYGLTERVEPDTDDVTRSRDTPMMEEPYAYLVEWTSRKDAQFLSRLLQEDIKLRFASDEFEIDGRTYGPGTLIITRTGNTHMGEAFDDIVRSAADEFGRSLHATETGMVDRGSDFGSNQVPFLERPTVAMLAGEPLFSYSVGEIWHYFDQQVDYPVTLLNADGFNVATLEDYDVLVLPSGSYGDVLDEDAMDALTDWVQRGGQLIAMETAVGTLANTDAFSIEQKDVEGEPEEPELRTFGERQREAARQGTPGSIHRTTLDATHPLGFGLGNDYFTLKRSSAAYTYLDDGWTVGALEEGAPTSGFMGHEAQEQMDETLVFGVEEMGQGRVVYFVDNPLFRAFWYNGSMLFGNAVFLVGNE